MRSDAGFSLIEVMVALAIFGLATVALIRLQGVSRDDPRRRRHAQ